MSPGSSPEQWRPGVVGRCLMRGERQARPVVLLRPVPGTSAIHELWAGTKLIVVFAVSLLLSFYPGWIPIGLVAVLLVAALRIARIPRACCRRFRSGCGS